MSRVVRLCLYRLTADGGCIMRQMRTDFNWNKSDPLNLNSFWNAILDIMLGNKYAAVCIYAEKSVKQGSRLRLICLFIKISSCAWSMMNKWLIWSSSFSRKTRLVNYSEVFTAESFRVIFILCPILEKNFKFFFTSQSKSFMKQLLVSGLNQTCFVNH